MAIDLLTYEFLKRYVEGANMGANATPRGKWSANATYNTGNYVTYQNEVYIVPTDANGNNQENVNAVPGTDTTIWDKIAGVNSEANILLSDRPIYCVTVARYDKDNDYIYLDPGFNFKEKLEANDIIVYKDSDGNWVYDEDGALQINLSCSYLRQGSSGKYSAYNANLSKVYLKTKDDESDYLVDIDKSFDKYNLTGAKLILNGGIYGNEDFVLEGFDYLSVEEGRGTEAYLSAHAEGLSSKAFGFGSHAENYLTKALGTGSHAEGAYSEAIGLASHAEGDSTLAYGNQSHAEGQYTQAKGRTSHAEGFNTNANIKTSHAEGYATETLAKAYRIKSIEIVKNNSEIVTECTIIFNNALLLTDGVQKGTYISFLTEEYKYRAKIQNIVDETTIVLDILDSPTLNTILSGELVEGIQVMVDGGAFGNEDYILPRNSQISAHAEGVNTKAYIHGHAEGRHSEARGHASHAEGRATIAHGEYSHTEGYYSTAKGNVSHAEGSGTEANGDNSHTEGNKTKAECANGHAEGNYTHSENLAAHAEGDETWATGYAAHAEGKQTRATGDYSHAEGRGEGGLSTVASGEAAHAEGRNTRAAGQNSHAGGRESTAAGIDSFVHGFGSTDNGKTQSVVLGTRLSTGAGNQTIFGYWNEITSDIFVLGNGNSSKRSNAMTVDKDGNMELAGTYFILKSSDSNKKFKITVNDSGNITATEIK